MIDIYGNITCIGIEYRMLSLTVLHGYYSLLFEKNNISWNIAMNIFSQCLWTYIMHLTIGERWNTDMENHVPHHCH